MKVITKRSNGTKRVVTENKEPSRTDPSWKDQVNANTIVQKYLKTGQITHLAKNQGRYADVSKIPDLGGALLQVMEAQNAFDALPSDLRRRFNNNPVEMVDFLQDPNNKQEAIALGIFKKPDELPVRSELPAAATNSKTKTKQKLSTDVPINDDKLNDDE